MSGVSIQEAHTGTAVLIVKILKFFGKLVNNHYPSPCSIPSGPKLTCTSP